MESYERGFLLVFLIWKYLVFLQELEHVNEELGKERLKLEQLASELSEEYDQIKR